MAEEYKKTRTKKSAAYNPETKPDSMADEIQSEKRSEELYEKSPASRLYEERMLAIFQSNQDQLSASQELVSTLLEMLKKMSGQRMDPDEQLALMESSRRRSVPDTSFVVDPSLVPGKRSKERQTDKLFAYCESSYIYFKEEPIEDEAGPGLKM
jgi:hypothetical protein